MLATDVWVAGVDGCKGGWIVALRRLDDPASATLQLCSTFADVLALPQAPTIIAVDIPIGLAPLATVGGRRADIEARANLGARQSAVFAMPARAAVMETDYRAACTVALAHSDPPRMISKQAFYLFPKIREVDAAMTPALQDRVVECHPELAFWALNGQVPLDLPKKVKSQANAPGLALRRTLLAAAGYPARLLQAQPFKARDAGADDLLDALANSWSAARIAIGRGRRFPAEPLRDARGLRMEIWC
jgi:predicted RNase H-like nuclease